MENDLMTSDSHLFWFPKTKLLLPQVGQDVLPRPRLSEALHTAVTTPFVLVLDDLHRVSDPAIHQMLDYLLEQLPPMMHIVATTRYDLPLKLSRLRARGQLVITQRTAKAHVSNILHKLQVTTRMEVVARAHELSLF